MERLQHIQGAIFDLDGTLLDSMWVWAEIDRRFLSKRGFAVPPDYLAAVNGLDFIQAARYTVDRFGLDETPETLVAEWSETARAAYAQEIGLKPFAADYLRALHSRGVKLGIATSAAPELYVPALTRGGVFDLFSAATLTKEVSRGKAFPDIYIETAARLNLSPAECAVFEDISIGVRSAKAGGFLAVGVFDRYADADTPRYADIYIDSFAALL